MTNKTSQPHDDTTTPSVFARYDAWRTRRFLANEAQMAHYLPTWRTQRRRRQLAVSLWAILTLMAITAISTLFVLEPAIAWIPLTIAMCVAWTLVNLTSNRQGEAPRHALDEWELTQRDAARSIGLTVTQALAALPAMGMVFLSTFEIGDAQLLAYGGGMLVITGVLFGGTLPTALIAWNRPDDERG